MFNIEGTEYFLAVCGDIRGKTMMELGAQEIWDHARTRFNAPYHWAKDWFMAAGATEHVSIDKGERNDKHVDPRSIQLDLSKPITRDYWDDHFDFVTNVGTLEHITPKEGQFTALANMHRWCKPGGLMIHQLPPVGHWLDHCWARYDESFIRRLAALNQYEIVNMERTKLPTLSPTVEYLSAALRKTNDDFFTDERDFLLEAIEWKAPVAV